MTNQNYDPNADPERSGSGTDPYGAQGTEEQGATSTYPDLGRAEGDLADPLYSEEGVNDEGTAGAGTGYTGSSYGTGGDFESGVVTTGAYGAGVSAGTYGASSDEGSAKDKAKQVAGTAADKASEVKDTAAQKASELKDTAVERGSDVAAVAKDELSRLTGEARSQVQNLWSQASVQLREQVDSGRHQFSDLLRSLADELGEMASKSTQSGPVTTLAKQAAYRGGELSHWLANAEPNDLMNDIRRFARRRPFVFLGGAALAGVLVGRLGRSLMAVAQDSDTTTSGAIGTRAYDSYGSVPATSGVTTTPAVTVAEVPQFGAGDVTSQPSGYASGTTSVPPLPGDTAGGGYR